MSEVTNLISGITPNDKKIELFADRTIKKVFFIQNGKTKPFSKLNNEAKSNLLELLLNDDVAMRHLAHLPLSVALEVFVMHCFGAADNQTDIYEDNSIGNIETSACTADCHCKTWKSKKIMVNGSYVTPREMQLLRLLASDYPDKQIAMMLDISQSTVDTHKANLMRKLHVNSKAGIITTAIKLNLLNI